MNENLGRIRAGPLGVARREIGTPGTEHAPAALSRSRVQFSRVDGGGRARLRDDRGETRPVFIN